MTRGQRRTHAIAFRALALFLFAALGFALYRRQLAATTEQASLGRAPIHDTGAGRP